MNFDNIDSDDDGRLGLTLIGIYVRMCYMGERKFSTQRKTLKFQPLSTGT